MEKVLDLYASRINEEYLRELPIPYLFALNEYDLAFQFLSLIKNEPKDPYTNFLRGVCFFYKKEYIHSKFYFILVKDNPEFKEETDKFFQLLEKVMPSNGN